MMLLKKRFFVILSTALLLISNVNCMALEMQYDSSYSSNYEAIEIQKVIDLILQNYSGNEINSDLLISAAYNGMFSILDDYSHYLTDDQFNNLIKDMSKEPTEIVKIRKIEDILSGENNSKNKSIRYIRIDSFKEDVDIEFKTAIDKVKSEGVSSIILDLRSNFGGYVDEAVSICKHIIPKGNIVSLIDKNGQFETFTSDLQQAPFKFVVLIDEYTASSSEIVAAAIKESGIGILVGQKTFGKGVVQSTFELPKGGATLTTHKYLTRNGVNINEVGITPDILITIPLNQPLLDSNDDLVLKTAYKELLK